ncbi:hypothetical protein [Nocardioides sp. URHA0032]|uniref:hypothetical protein n=1 Tax=Nocardioides sp. URHA0032 TaxID=1380388 RepID=UPI000ABF4F23|nr:hypothetical protein [Nocardioides sp. URHA0032]
MSIARPDVTTPAPVWIECLEPGCPNGIGVHWRHAENFTDRFYCPDHNKEN